MRQNFNSKTKEYEQEKSSGHDSLLGAMMLEHFVGVALADMAADAVDMPDNFREIDYGVALDLYDEYRRDRTNGGGFKTGVKNDFLNGLFNRIGVTSPQDENRPEIAYLRGFHDMRGMGTHITASASP